MSTPYQDDVKAQEKAFDRGWNGEEEPASGPIELYNDKHVAARLWVTRPAIANWRNRYSDTPPPYAVIAERPGINRITPPTPLWDAEGLDAWEVWHKNQFRKEPKEVLTGTK